MTSIRMLNSNVLVKFECFCYLAVLVSKTKHFFDEEMVSFDVVGLFTNVPLDHTIRNIITRIYDKGEIKTDIPREDMTLLLEMCTKNVHFTFNNQTYQQIDGVAMGSPLGPVIAGIFMVELETNIVPKMSDSVKIWKRYVDDTFCVIKKGKDNIILRELNKNEHVKFTSEKQVNNMLAFLDVLLINRFGTIDTTVYRKPTNTDIYINWNSFAPDTWKKGTLKMLIQRAFQICNKPYFLKAELDHLKMVFHTINGYPLKVINQSIKEVKRKLQTQTETNQNESDELKPAEAKIVLPYAGIKGEIIGKEINKSVKKVFDNRAIAKVAFKGKKLTSFFSVKDKTKTEHKHNVVYRVKCPDCPASYIGEAGRRIQERVDDHGGRDRNSHVLKHSNSRGHTKVKMKDFTILGNNFMTVDHRKISEAFLSENTSPR
ncbi:uncharacterized protein [Clytia hemisphaerica]|uniref:uncharacterized protein n=1 Tax=Clytia hemisphaerica TaxID=252671 RepID=UPI0034D78861